MSETHIMKINTALSNKPFYVKIDNPDVCIDTVFSEAISALKNGGKPLESKQLAELYKSHTLFNQGKVVQKGDLFSALSAQVQQVGQQRVQVAEVDLITSHAGGMQLLSFNDVPDPLYDKPQYCVAAVFQFILAAIKMKYEYPQEMPTGCEEMMRAVMTVVDETQYENLFVAYRLAMSYFTIATVGLTADGYVTNIQKYHPKIHLNSKYIGTLDDAFRKILTYTYDYKKSFTEPLGPKIY